MRLNGNPTTSTGTFVNRTKTNQIKKEVPFRTGGNLFFYLDDSKEIASVLKETAQKIALLLLKRYFL